MNYQSLYQQFKWKQLHSRQIQQNELARIQSACNQSKINLNSTSILLKRTMEILEQFDDDQIVNLETSIPMLQAVGILQVLRSVAEAQAKLINGQGNQSSAGTETRLRNQAQFLYYLWDMLDQQQLQCRQIKHIIELLQSRKKPQMKAILLELYGIEQKIQCFINSWIQLSANQQYYKHQARWIKPGASTTNINNNNNNKQNTGHQLQQDPQLISYYQSKQDQSGEGQEHLGSPIYENKRHNHSGKSGKYLTNSDGINNIMPPGEFGYTCVLNHSQEKQLIGRLYKNDIYRAREEQRKEKEEQREKEQLQQCTFKPNLLKRNRSTTKNYTNAGGHNGSKSYSQIKGYQKAINRLKTGMEKNKISREMREYKPVGENYEKLKQKGINPPKFLHRKKKEEQKVLFIISFDLGRHKTNVKIRENDTEDSVAERICKIYSLKKQFYDEIREIVRNQLQTYYQQIEQDVQTGEQERQQQYEDSIF